MRFDSALLQQCWFLAGPTACGKTATGLVLAERLIAEIVSLDSMAIYRRMDIGTAKPTRAERDRVPHHLIDIRDPHEEFSVAEYLREAEAACRGIVERGRVPLFVGGTGLYLRALLRGVFEGPAADLELRSRLEGIAKEQSPETLHARLEKVDPVRAAQLAAQDVRRVVRALEIYELTGRPASEQQQEGPLPEEERPRHVYWLSPPRGWLHQRINTRVDAMFAAGLVEEVRGLVDDFPGLGRTASQGLGYKEVVSYLQGEVSREAAIEDVKTRTRQFAKRQETWFRNLVECRPVPMQGMETPEVLAEEIFSLGR